MSHRVVGTALVITGILTIVSSLLVDVVGLGGEVGIGWKQMAGLIMGILIGAAGLIMRSGSAQHRD